MLQKISGILLILLAAVSVTNASVRGKVLGAASAEPKSYTPMQAKVTTTTAFEKTEIVEYEPLPFPTVYKGDSESEFGTEVVLQEGKDGTRTLTYLATHWGDEVIDKQLIGTEIDEPTAQLVKRGTKIVWRTLTTPDEGTIKYWHKMSVWATKYDHTCPGCDMVTAVGATLKKGVCATDPKVIPLRTAFYIPGYGKCTALDVGGAIKGNKIDMAYEDASRAAWGAGWKEIYLMTSPPSL